MCVISFKADDSAFFSNKDDLGYLRVKIAAAARKWLMSCICILRLSHDEADVVRLARK